MERGLDMSQRKGFRFLMLQTYMRFMSYHAFHRPPYLDVAVRKTRTCVTVQGVEGVTAQAG
jgi:hypothetical protein